MHVVQSNIIAVHIHITFKLKHCFCSGLDNFSYFYRLWNIFMTKFFVLEILFLSFVNQIMVCFNGNTQGFLQLKIWANACWRIFSLTNRVLLWTVSQICLNSLSIIWKLLGWERREGGMSHCLTGVSKTVKPLTCGILCRPWELD